MLNQLVEQLALIPVLDEPAIQRIKEYIQVKFPAGSASEHATTLANTVHRVLDRELGEFSPDLRNSIRHQALETAVGKASFSLCAGDLFQACVQSGLDAQSETEVVAWLNRQRGIANLENFPPVPPEALRSWLNFTLAANPAVEACTTPWTTWEPKAAPVHFPLAKQRLIPAAVLLLLVLLVGVLPVTDFNSWWGLGASSQAVQANGDLATGINSQANQLPANLKYKQVNVNKLKNYLATKDSLLAEEPYFTAILESSREFNVNPLVLFAIAGHEQGFVPRTGPNSGQIINNPFNVFHSWKEYNTTIKDSSRIAARTVVHAAAGRPQKVNPFLWVNKRYAEDPNWWKGVSSIYADLEELQQ